MEMGMTNQHTLMVEGGLPRTLHGQILLMIFLSCIIRHNSCMAHPPCVCQCVAGGGPLPREEENTVTSFNATFVVQARFVEIKASKLVIERACH